MESNQLNSPKVFSHKGQGKDKHFSTQMPKVFAAFHSQPKTMLMASVETNILRANICRYVAKWRKDNRITVVLKCLKVTLTTSTFLFVISLVFQLLLLFAS